MGRGFPQMGAENLSLGEEGDATLAGDVNIVEALGEVTPVYVNCGGDLVLAKLDGNVPLKRSERVHPSAAVKDVPAYP